VSPLTRKSNEWVDGLSTTRIDPGARVIFMPDQPGVFVALQLGDAPSIIDDTQSMGSFISSASKTSVQPTLKKQQLPANTFLDLDKLPKKTQSILKNFEMIVIGKIISTHQQGDEEEEKDDELEFDDVEIGTPMKSGAVGSGERKTFCEVQVE